MIYHNQEVLPLISEWLSVSHSNKVYFECYGNRAGIPVIVLHGGPGYFLEKEMLTHFDLSKWYVILFDQRGCGKSEPKGSTLNNNTQLLIDDINALSKYLNVNQFVIKGESWGTTLALAYAQQNPNKVIALVLNGVFLGDAEESLIGKSCEVKKFFPEYWEELMSLLTNREQKNPYATFSRYVLGKDREKQKEFSRRVIVLELLTESINTSREKAEKVCEKLDYVNIAKIECHYTINDFFLRKGQLLAGCDKISQIPTFIVHGRYDMIVPVASAWYLHKKMKRSEIFIIEESGHSSYEEKTSEHLIQIFRQLSM